MLDFFKELHPTFEKIEDSEIFSSPDCSIGWHSVIFDLAGFPLSGGTRPTRGEARRVGIAEGLERGLVIYLSKSEHQRRFMLDLYPGTTGFAFGFEERKAMLRSLCEGVERWAREQWIDHKKFLRKINLNNDDLSPLGKYYLTQFDAVDFYSRDIEVNLINGDFLKLRFGVAVARKDNGVFSGQRVSSLDEDIWTHSLVEAWRHYYIFTHSKFTQFHVDKISKRIMYFGNNGRDALNLIAQATDDNWSIPQVMLLEYFNVKNINGHLWRCLVDGFVGEDVGDETRFIY